MLPTLIPSSCFSSSLSQLSVYPSCLSHDRVLAHHLAGASDRTQDAQRLYAVASARYEDALQFAADDPVLMKQFAKCLCRLLQVELTATTAMGVSRGKAKVLEAIALFKTLHLADGIAEILLALPKEIDYSNLVAVGKSSKTLYLNYFFVDRRQLMSQCLYAGITDQVFKQYSMSTNGISAAIRL
jgi:hypothetical protein